VARSVRCRSGTSSAPRGQQLQAPAEPRENLLGRQDLDARCGKLQRERKAVEPTHDLHDVFVRLPPATELTRPLREQHRSVFEGQCRHGVLLLFRHVQRLATRREHARLERGDHRRRFGEQLLQVVQQEQQALTTQELSKIVPRPEDLRDGRPNERRIPHRGERNEPDAVGEFLDDRSGRMQRESCLPAATRPGEREQARTVRQHRLHLAQLSLPTHERRRLHGQVRLMERLQRREVLVTELVDLLGRRQVLEPVLTEVAHLGVTGEVAGCLRDQDLTAVADCCDARRPMHIHPDVALVCQHRLARVNPDPDLDRTGGEILLHLTRRCHRARRPRERDEERVTLRVHLDPVVARERLPQEPPMLREQLRVAVAMLLKQPRRALDVGEEKRDGPARQLGHGIDVERIRWVVLGSPQGRRHLSAARLRVSILLLVGGLSLLAAAALATSSTATSGRAVREGGTLKITLSSSDVQSLDPAIDFEAYGGMLQLATGAKLLSYRDAPARAGTVLYPEVAASLPRISNDGTTYTFTIRKGFRFNTGRPVTARSFEHAFYRVADAKSTSAGISFLGDVVGAVAYHEKKAKRIAGISVRGNRLTIRLTGRAPDFLNRVAMTFFSAVPEDLPISATGVKLPPSAGPFYFARRELGRLIVLKRNPYYGGRRPHHLSEIDGLRQHESEGCAAANPEGRTRLRADRRPGNGRGEAWPPVWGQPARRACTRVTQSAR
jgi:hypothetical protein